VVAKKCRNPGNIGTYCLKDGWGERSGAQKNNRVGKKNERAKPEVMALGNKAEEENLIRTGEGARKHCKGRKKEQKRSSEGGPKDYDATMPG